MSRLSPLRRPPIAFAHRGAMAHAPENTIESFELALRLGATGIESDVWLTADGVPVLAHDARVGSLLRRRHISRTDRSALPHHIPELAALFDLCGPDTQISLDVKDPAAFEAVVAEAHNAHLAGRLWLCYWDLERLVDWRGTEDRVRLVDSTRLAKITEGPERRAAALAEAGIDAINLPVGEWTGGLTTLMHRFDRYAFAWDAQFDRQLRAALDMGIDAVYSNHVDRMMQALGTPPP